MEKPNLIYIKEISDNDASFEESIISILKKEFPEEFSVFLINYKNKNYIETANNIHKLKHKISILGLKKGYELATKFELEIKEGKTELYSDFINVLNKIAVYLGNK